MDWLLDINGSTISVNFKTDIKIMVKIVITKKPIKQIIHKITISLKRLHLYIDYHSDRDWTLIGVAILEKWTSNFSELYFISFVQVAVFRWMLRIGIYGNLGNIKQNNEFKIEW